MKVITVDWKKCTGCRSCELICSLKHTKIFNPSRSRIHVIGYLEPFSLPITCFQCEKPYCAEVCPTRAIIKDEAKGTVSVIKEKCIGCKLCTMACPFGSIVFSSEERVAVKCDLCDGEPQCVALCPAKALEFREADTSMIHKQRAIREKLKAIYESAEEIVK